MAQTPGQKAAAWFLQFCADTARAAAGAPRVKTATAAERAAAIDAADLATGEFIAARNRGSYASQGLRWTAGAIHVINNVPGVDSAVPATREAALRRSNRIRRTLHHYARPSPRLVEIGVDPLTMERMSAVVVRLTSRNPNSEWHALVTHTHNAAREIVVLAVHLGVDA